MTGASSGIGQAVARLLGENGAKVVLGARSAEKLAELEKEIPGSFAVMTDMRKEGDVENLIKKAREKFGRIDILINNAGQGLIAKIEDIKLEDYRSIVELNVFAVLRAMQEVIPIMREQKGGLILNISSMVSKNHFPELAAYASTKYALNALSYTAAEELADDNIRVLTFCPKMTKTPFGHNTLGEKYDPEEEWRRMKIDTAEEVAEEIVKQIESEEAEVMM